MKQNFVRTAIITPEQLRGMGLLGTAPFAAAQPCQSAPPSRAPPKRPLLNRSIRFEEALSRLSEGGPSSPGDNSMGIERQSHNIYRSSLCQDLGDVRDRMEQKVGY